MAFPSTLSSFPRPSPTDRLNSPSHSALHNTVSSALGQVEAVIGVDTPSPVPGTLMGDVRSPSSDGGGHIQTANKGGTGQTSYTKGDLLVAQSSSVLTKLAVGANTTILTADSTTATGVRWGAGKFGGTGADGSLSITSGKTTQNMSSVLTYIKNYTSISITGTGQLAFSSPNDMGTIVVLKSQGDVTLTSSNSAILASVIGGLGGAGASGSNVDGNNGTSGISNMIKTTTFGAGGGQTGDVRGAGGSVFGVFNGQIVRNVPLFAGAGGGGAGTGSGGSNGQGGGGGASAVNAGTDGTGAGSAGQGNGGNGGRGGGAIYIECGGTFTCSSSIIASGGNGLAGAATNGSGGGGGGGGTIVVLYNALGSNTGAYVATGGSGGAAAGSGGAGGNGGNGFSIISANTDFL